MSAPSPAPHEMAFFSTLVRCGSLSATARELNLSTAAISKRLSALESRLGVQLLMRTTRRIGLTSEGELYLQHARRILSDIDDLEQLLRSTRSAPQGLLRVNATLGFGRSHVAPRIAAFARLHPQLQVQLQLTVNPPPLSEDAYDVCIRFGEPPDARVIARLMARNRRLLCAAPAYLAAQGTPRHPQDLLQHQCIGIRQGDEAYGIWHLKSGKSEQAVKVRGQLTTNDGEIAVQWALAGLGILMRAEWNLQRHLDSGALVQVLPGWQTPAADIYAVYPQALHTAARVRALVDFLSASFERPEAQMQPAVAL